MAGGGRRGHGEADSGRCHAITYARSDRFWKVQSSFRPPSTVSPPTSSGTTTHQLGAPAINNCDCCATVREESSYLPLFVPGTLRTTMGI